MRWSDQILLSGLLVLTFLLACFGNKDMDIWWHLKAGQAILGGQGIPRHDTDTVAGFGNDWIDLHWLFQVAAAALHRWRGMESADSGRRNPSRVGNWVRHCGESYEAAWRPMSRSCGSPPFW